VTLAGSQRLSDAWQAGRDPLTGYKIRRIGLNPDRKALYERIDVRAAAMFEAGLVEETAGLLATHEIRLDAPYPAPLPWALNSLGYRQAIALLRGETTREAAVAAAQQGHRNYAKRQMTWFRREPDVSWLHGFGDDPAIENQAMLLVAHSLEREPHV
jgi:tRNA dimethylallyltransferase